MLLLLEMTPVLHMVVLLDLLNIARMVGSVVVGWYTLTHHTPRTQTSRTNRARTNITRAQTPVPY